MSNDKSKYLRVYDEVGDGLTIEYYYDPKGKRVKRKFESSQ